MTNENSLNVLQNIAVTLNVIQNQKLSIYFTGILLAVELILEMLRSLHVVFFRKAV